MASNISKRAIFLVIIAILCLGSGGFILYLNATPAASSSVVASPSPTPEPNMVVSFSDVLPSPLPSPVYTPIATPLPQPSPKALAGTATPTPQRPFEASSEGGTPRPTEMPTPTPTPRPTPKPTPTPTPTPKPTPTPATTSGALITLSFDDDLKSAYKNAYPLLHDAGVQGTWYIITGALTGEFGSSYMKSTQVLELYQNGQEIGAHTQTHPHLSTLGEDRIRQEIQGSKQDLENLGISVSTFCYPYGEYNSTVLTIARDSGFTGARSTRDGFVNPGNDLFTLKSPSLQVTTTPDQVQVWIDQAMKNGNWLILTFHDVSTKGDKYSVTLDSFKKMFEEVLTAQNNGARVVTVKEGIEIMNGR